MSEIPLYTRRWKAGIDVSGKAQSLGLYATLSEAAVRCPLRR